MSGVSSAGLSTQLHPAARAGASFQAAITSGPFQGTICAATPIGSCRISPWKRWPGTEGSKVAPGSLVHQPA